MDIVKNELKKLLENAGAVGPVEFSLPPKPELGDYAFGCFLSAKELHKSPVEVAKDLADKLNASKGVLDKAVAAGPYVNLYLNNQKVAELVLAAVKKAGQKYGAAAKSTGQKIMVEFGHPNTHKAFHIGHLRNLVTGESLVRMFENAGNKVVRANYQGDVGLHIAKCLYAILNTPELLDKVKTVKTLEERATFLGTAYAAGSKAYEESDDVKTQVADINKKIYDQDKLVAKLYKTTRQWSLEYFDHIYERLGTHYDRFFFESEVFELGKEIVKKNMPKIFKESQGAVIFPGSEYGLHDRVFLNSQGVPTYEAKEMGLAQKQFGEFKPDHIYHVVATEQSEYFKVVIKALEQVMPQSVGREHHLVYGWVRLKEGKMSSRLGNVILGEWLVDEVKKQISEVMAASTVKDKATVAEKVSVAAIKYALLKTGSGNDIAFDIKESISLTGDSGPYLMYVCARIQSILRKEKAPAKAKTPASVAAEEKALLLEISRFPDVTAAAAAQADPSLIARYLFGLAQKFNNFYHACPVLTADALVKPFRLKLIEAVLLVATRGLGLLGIQTVGEM